MPTPEALGKDSALPSIEDSFSYGGAKRRLRYKEVPHPVLWRYGSRGTPLRLLILMPVPYGGGSNKDGSRRKKNYNDRAYLLTTDLTTPAPQLIQAYLDRWQIEVLHRALKHDVGLGQDQCRHPRAIERVHAALVAMYAMINVAALETHGPIRTDVFPTFPRWRRDYERSRTNRRVAKGDDPPVLRPSPQDIIALLREQLLLRWVQGKARIQ